MTSDTFEPRTLAGLLDAVVAKDPSRVAVQSPSQTDHLGIGDKNTATSPQSLSWTFSDLRNGSTRLASRLRADGIRRGSRIAALLYNQAEWALLFWTSVRMGCQFVPLDPRVLGQPTVAAHIIRSIDAAAIFVSTSEMARQVDKTLTREGKPLPLSAYLVSSAEYERLPDGWRALESIMVGVETKSFDKSIEETHLEPSDAILILATSGTTALPKLCPHTSITLRSASQVCQPLQLDTESSLCQQLPNFHIYGIFLNLAFWLAGGRLIVPSRSFDPRATLEAMSSNRKVYLPCVPSMLQALRLQLSTAEESQDTRPFAILTGGAVVTSETLAVAKLLQPEMIFAGYGATEAVVTPMHRIDEEREKRTEAGVPVAKVETEQANVRVCQLGSRTPLPRGQVGEIHQGGLGVIQGYLGVGDNENLEFYEENGVRWKAMGDQGYVDSEGHVYVLGRYDDIIIRGGENISPLAIEECLVKIAEIEDAAVVGVPDPVAGEVPVAIVRQRKPGIVPVKRLQAVVANRLGRAFSPTMILDLRADLEQEHFPATATGKIQRKVLKELVLEHVRHLATLKKARLSSDLTKGIMGSWAAVTGLAEEDIDPEAPIETFADSIMLMQFLSEAQAQGWRITREDMAVLDTVRAQAEFIVSQRLGKDKPSVVTVLSR
ncbi:acetyl-CoA synthetase-like protein [Aspergillus steynii IBT 23096]|uniref:Acetyl-CoA synthetase-like protein n=1 Tax=Aspergillus steynii IBT 23096 TaxID=1392250 RepID=A0A2I2G3C5_9EURO|nr:acetyl-CoA synthetase-like protein [Aspergillus steynii IBT 23096]PLB47378.1 acetyl-CoA synthetase-like protein [Aspergillus steynii IBT 23096]